MKRVMVSLHVLFIFMLSRAQVPVGTWIDNLAYNSAFDLAIGQKTVYASTGSSVFSYEKDYSELRKISRVTGLTETGVSAICWSDDNSLLVIAYSSANVDLLKKNRIYNIPDISRKYIPGKKSINKIRIKGRYAYLACSFGIVLIDLTRNEISDTWKPGNEDETAEVWDITFDNDNNIYAATGMGVFSASLSEQGLAYFGNWSKINSLPSPSAKYTLALFAGGKLYVNRSGQYIPGDSVYVIGQGCVLFNTVPGVFNKSLDIAGNGIIISSGGLLRYFFHDGSVFKTISSYPWGPASIFRAGEDNGDIWIADAANGLVRWAEMSGFTPLTITGPVTNDAISIVSKKGKTITCGGGIDATWNKLGRPMMVSVYEDNNWTHLTPGDVSDPLRAVIDDADPDHFFISTWGWGLLEYKDNLLVNRYHDGNSPLQTIIPGQSYVRVCGIAMDENSYLWLTQTEVPGTLKALKPDGNWIVNPATANVPTVGDLVITGGGQKWVVLPRGNGLFILDDNKTPEDFNDDTHGKITVTDTDMKVFPNVYCLARDLDGHVWVGTDQGPVIYFNPDKVLSENTKASRIKIPRNDGSGLADYMLGTETITSIAVDGANRKWLGTLSSGAYLLSADGTTLMKNYNESNSPMFSNSIASIAVDDKTGTVWFATSKGILSVRGEAIAGNDSFSGVYSFPNPVREDFTGNVTITGLMKDTRVRITDVSGNLVHSTVSDGGQASWDLTTYNGRRVATGVYMVFCASADGSLSCVTKILVVR